MPLRESLVPNSTPERVQYLAERIIEIESNLENDSVTELIDAFAAETGTDTYNLDYFRDFNSFQSVDEFASDAAAPRPIKVDDITRDELVWIVERIMEADDHSTYYLRLLEQNVPDQAVSDLIYWPDERGFEDSLSADEIVTIALDPDAHRSPRSADGEHDVEGSNPASS